MLQLDINIYFRDKCGNICVVASGGGDLPQYLLENEELFRRNLELDKFVCSLDFRVKIWNNPVIPDILKYQYLSDNIDYSRLSDNIDYSKLYMELINSNRAPEYDVKDFPDYFYSFNVLAKKGLYVYDKLNINDSDDSNYVLISKPIKDSYYNERLNEHITFQENLNMPTLSRCITKDCKFCKNEKIGRAHV